MHELLLAQHICDTVLAHVSEGQRVTTVVVECGPLAGVVPEALDLCFPIAAQNSGLTGARLEMRHLSAQANCPKCRERFCVLAMWDRCPACGHGPVTIEDGRVLCVKQIEVEDV